MKDDELRKLVDEATPGPWKVAPCHGSLAYIMSELDASIAAVASRYTEKHDEINLPAEANASLIALAPDLAREVLALREAAKDAGEMLALCRDMQAQVAHPEDPLLSQTNTALANLRTVLGESE